MGQNYKASGDLAKLIWTLESGSSPLQRIYSTVKHLGSKQSFQEVREMVDAEVKAGTLVTLSHPLREDEFFYSLASNKADVI